MKNKFVLGFLTCLIAVSIIGCGGLLSKNSGKMGKAAKQEAAAAIPIDTTEKQLNDIKDKRLTSIGAWSGGVEYSLNKVTNQEPAVDIAQEINSKVQALANKPTLKEQEEIFRLIDSLLTNAVAGKKMLAEKNEEIIKLQTTIGDLNSKHASAVADYRSIAEASARQNDAYKTTLQEMDAGWGLSAIWYGIKKLISRIALTLGILAVLFIVLRALSATNPIAASIFAIFNQVGSWIINILKGIFPKATSISGLVPHSDYKGYKDTLSKIVDAIETVKSKESLLKKTGSTTCISMDDLTTELSKLFTPDDADRVTNAKKDLLWKL